METVGDRIAKAQASGDLVEIRAALRDAEAAGADPAQIQQALAEVERLSAAQGANGSTPAAPSPADVAAQARSRAEAHKKRGNERLKENTKSAAKDAMECFTMGLEVQCTDNVLNAQLYSNRAHVRLLLRQFVEAVDDCRKAIELDHKNMKAYWRAAKASLHLDLFQNGIDFCEGGLKQQPNDADLMKMRSACAEKLAGHQRRRAELSATTSKDEFNADEAMAVQEKVNGLNEQVESLKAVIGSKQREKMKLSLTMNNLSEVPVETNTYVAVGRCFLKKERDYLNASLESMSKSLEEEIPRLTKTLQELDKRREAAEKELKEMIQAFRTQAESERKAG